MHLKFIATLRKQRPVFTKMKLLPIYRMLGIAEIAHFTTQQLATPVRRLSFHLMIGDGVMSEIGRKFL